MKHPVWDRILILLCSLAALSGAAGVVMLLIGKISLETIVALITSIDMSRFVVKAAMVGIAAVFALLFLLLFAMILPSRKKRSSNYAIQRNENGMVRISLKALESLVQKCLNQHAELKVVTSSLYSDEESIRVDVHISLQSDISMPLAIPADEQTGKSPYAIPNALLGLDAEPLPHAQSDQENAQEEKEAALTQESESEPTFKQSEEEPAEQEAQAEEAEEQGEQA